MDENKLERSAVEDFKCPHTDCCDYLKYQQCHNHSHVLCERFEQYYQSLVDKKQKRNI